MLRFDKENAKESDRTEIRCWLMMTLNGNTVLCDAGAPYYEPARVMIIED